ncbi:MAG: VCBS repeat-containing protein [Planctomycetota bacterium]
MPLTTFALLSLAAQAPTPGPAPRNPRTDALRVSDAVYSIPEVTGEIVPVPDCDGDGLSDLAIARGGKWSESERVDLMSSKNGSRFRTLGKLTRTDAGTSPWIAGGDLDGDHFPDLIVGEPKAEDSLGRVTMISGKEGSTIAVIRGKARRERLGSSLAFLGDLNGDEFDDFAILGGESGSGGFVTVRSGKDQSELWRVSGREHVRDFNTHVRSTATSTRTAAPISWWEAICALRIRCWSSPA